MPVWHDCERRSRFLGAIKRTLSLLLVVCKALEMKWWVGRVIVTIWFGARSVDGFVSANSPF